jgi:hypothetical protein
LFVALIFLTYLVQHSRQRMGNMSTYLFVSDLKS